MVEPVAALEGLTQRVRRCFQLLRTLADDLHGDLSLNGSMRAVLEHLVATGVQTVPQIAASKSVTRQSIQQFVDQLLAAGLVRQVANPDHRRSPLIAPTEAGRALFATARQREREVLLRLAGALDIQALTDADAGLASFNQALETLIHARKDVPHDPP